MGEGPEDMLFSLPFIDWDEPFVLNMWLLEVTFGNSSRFDAGGQSLFSIL